jgi:hypothetical protein
MIAGGLLACLPDYVTETLGRHTLIGSWNSASHQTWFPLYYRLIMTHRAWRPPIALACVLSETAIFVGGVWLVFRRLRRRQEGAVAP